MNGADPVVKTANLRPHHRNLQDFRRRTIAVFVERRDD